MNSQEQRCLQLVTEAATKINIIYTSSEMPPSEQYRMTWSIVDDAAYRIYNPEDDALTVTPAPATEEDTYYTLAQYLAMRGLYINITKVSHKVAKHYRAHTGHHQKMSTRVGSGKPSQPISVYALSEFPILDEFFKLTYPKQWRNRAKVGSHA